MVSHVSSIAVIHHEVKIFSVLEGAEHVDEEGVGHFLQELFLVHDGVN